MSDMSVSRKVAAALIVASMSLAPTFVAAQTVLKFATTIPATHPVGAEMFTGWVKKVNDALGPEVQIQLVPGPVIANAQNVWERTVNGVVDIGWGIHGAVGLPFAKTTITSLPFLVEDTATGSAALWRLYATGLIADEHKDVKVLGLVTTPPQGLHSTKPVATLADVKGMKIRAADRIAADVASALGGSAISVPAPEVYQALSQGVVTGVIGGWTLVQSFKLQEVVNHHLEGALGAPAGFVIMNRQAYDRLPPRAKEAIDRLSGEGFSRDFGDWFQKNAAQSRNEVAGLKNQTMRTLSPQEAERWKQAVSSVYKQWTDRTPGGDKVLAAYRSELQKLHSSK